MKFQLNEDFPNATDEQKWEQFKLWRLQEMTQTDWTQTLDCSLSESDKNKYEQYRTFLKSAPNEYDVVEEITFPYHVEIIDYNMKIFEESYSLT